MIELRQTEAFASWFERLKDRDAKARIAIRLRRLSLGNPGDVKPAVAASANCGSITDRAIACISASVAPFS